MDFKIPNKLLVGSVFFIIVFINSCSKKNKSDIENTFYVELVNFNNDTLKQKLADNIFGKVSFYNNKQLEILSLNYVTDNLPEMHYYNNAEILKENIKDNTKKIRVEFKGDYCLDSIKYSLQKYKYKNKQWVKTSDLGEIGDTKKFTQPRNIINEYIRLIVLNIVQYSYN